MVYMLLMCYWSVFWPSQITCDHKTADGQIRWGWGQYISRIKQRAHQTDFRISNISRAGWIFEKYILLTNLTELFHVL